MPNSGLRGAISLHASPVPNPGLPIGATFLRAREFLSLVSMVQISVANSGLHGAISLHACNCLILVSHRCSFHPPISDSGHHGAIFLRAYECPILVSPWCDFSSRLCMSNSGLSAVQCFLRL